MRIQVKGRGGASADDELLARVEKKLGKVARQVSPLAELTIELGRSRRRAIAGGRGDPEAQGSDAASARALRATWGTR